MSRLLLFVLLPFLCTPAFAIYKCETQGATTYSDAPCPGGKSIDTLDAPPSAVADEQRAGRQLSLQKKQLQQLENQRHQREALEDKQRHQVARAHTVKQKKCTTSAMRKKWAEEDARNASGKAVSKAVLNARRSAEKHEMECGK